jgi:hypothetical protein
MTGRRPHERDADERLAVEEAQKRVLGYDLVLLTVDAT